MTRLRELIQQSVEFLKLWPGQMMPKSVAALGMFLADLQQHQIANETEVRAVTVCKKKIVQFSFDWSQQVPEIPRPRDCRGVCINLKILFFGLWRDTTMLSSRGKLKGKKANKQKKKTLASFILINLPIQLLCVVTCLICFCISLWFLVFPRINSHIL